MCICFAGRGSKATISSWRFRPTISTSGRRASAPISLRAAKADPEAIRYVDEVIPEESWEQKRTDVKEHGVSCFVIGDDWRGKFDFLKEEGCEVVYLERTPEVSSSGIKTDYAAGNRKI